MAIQKIRLEAVPTVTREDPSWLKQQFRSFPMAIDLSPDRFPHIAEWPEANPAQQFEVVRFPGETFLNWAAVDQRLS